MIVETPHDPYYTLILIMGVLKKLLRLICSQRGSANSLEVLSEYLDGRGDY